MMRKRNLIAVAIAAVLLGACASQPQVVAQTDACKLAPVTTASAVPYGKRQEPSRLEQQWARMQLQSTPYYRALERTGPTAGTMLQDAVRDCY